MRFNSLFSRPSFGDLAMLLNAIRSGKAPRIKFDTVVAGGGEAMTRVLERFGDRKLGGKVLVLSGGKTWMDVLPRHHQLGQSRKALLMNSEKFDNPNQLATIDEYKRELVDRQFAAVDKFEDGKLDVFETMLAKASRISKRLLHLDCADGTEIECGRLLLCTGVGRELTLASAGVNILNSAQGKRALLGEVSTPLAAMEKGGHAFKGKNVIVYGGGATGAWFIEWLLSSGVKGLQWIGRDFEGANPNGRNNDVMNATEKSRLRAIIETLKFNGTLDQVPDGKGLGLQLDVIGKGKHSLEADFVISAIGADPMAPLGVRSILGEQIYGELSPMFNSSRGFSAKTDCNSIIVTSTPMTTDRSFWKLDGKNGISWKELLETSYGNLSPENHVLAGLALTRLSAEAAVDTFEMTKSEGEGEVD